jgi:hypothetical protein
MNAFRMGKGVIRKGQKKSVPLDAGTEKCSKT